MLTKTQPPITAKNPERGDYGMRFELHHRRPWNKLQPEQRAVILKASAHQLRTWAEQMDSEAADMLTSH